MNRLILQLILLLSFIFASVSSFAQIKIGNNPISINANAIFEMESTNKGMLLPRLTTANRDMMTSPPVGLFIYNTDIDSVQYRNASKWVSIGSVDNIYSANGNIGSGRRVTLTDSLTFGDSILVIKHGSIGIGTRQGKRLPSTNSPILSIDAGTQQLPVLIATESNRAGMVLRNDAIAGTQNNTTEVRFQNFDGTSTSSMVGQIGFNDANGAEPNRPNSMFIRTSRRGAIYFHRYSGAGSTTMTIDSSGAVGINIGDDKKNDPSALLQVNSTSRGFLPPRMTMAQITAIASPAEGLTAYCTDCTPKTLLAFDGTNWATLTGAILPSVINAPVLSTTPTTFSPSTTVTFNVSTGSWSGSPSSFTYQWKVNGANAGTNANTLTRTVALNDVIFCIVSARNGTGNSSTNSDTINVYSSEPSVVNNPTILAAGNHLYVNTPASFSRSSKVTHQWKANGSIIPNATNVFLYVPDTYWGQTITYEAVAQNNISQVVASSNNITAGALFDEVPVPVRAFSLRRLSSSYAGPLVRLRRSSDNAQSDFGADAATGFLDLNAMLTWASGTDAFVQTWYDQSGNNAHATQNTAASQPILVANGVLQVNINDKPALYGREASQMSSTNPNVVVDNVYISLVKTDHTTSVGGAVDLGSSPGYRFAARAYNTAIDWYNGANTGINSLRITNTVPLNTWGIYGFMSSAAEENAMNIFAQGQLVATKTRAADSRTSTRLNLFRDADVNLEKGSIAEVLIYNSAITPANRAIIEKNQCGFYGVQIP